VAREALVELAELAVQVAQEALAELVVPVAQEALAELVVPAAEQELNRVEAQERDPAAGPVPRQAAELEHGPVAGPERDPVAVPRRTKSVTAAHHRGLVPAPRVEDSAAAAETTRVPVAAEVGTAWEAAATAVVVAVEA